MKVKELIKKLQEVGNDRTVFIHDKDGNPVDFSGLSYDDDCDIQLYIIGGDNPA